MHLDQGHKPFMIRATSVSAMPGHRIVRKWLAGSLLTLC